MATYVLFESATGYALFEAVEFEKINAEGDDFQRSITDLQRFSSFVKLKAFQPFETAEIALENQLAIAEGKMSDTLKNFLEMNLPKVKEGKKAKFQLGVGDSDIGKNVQECIHIPCTISNAVLELLRGIRAHFTNFVKDLTIQDWKQAQLGLGHAYSRSVVKFDVKKVDKHIIQSIALLDQLDKDINTFAMRVREWYSWHFPELVRIVPDNLVYCQLAKFIKNRKDLHDEKLPELEGLTQDAEKAKEILDASKKSMGQDITDFDILNIELFATRVIELAQYRKQLHEYLTERMSNIAPNLSTLIGEMVGARLIAHAGSLTNLAKYPASTVQILGAEKALFRALKTRGNTPKYGLIFHSSFIGRAGAKNKGRISRYLANKCSIAARIDCFSEKTTDEFGKKLKDQVEERLNFYASGVAPHKNADMMKEVIAALKTAGEEKPETAEPEKKKKKKKKAADAEEQKEEAAEAEAPAVESGDKKKKKKKKAAAEEEKPVVEEVAAEEPKKEKKDKKKKKHAPEEEAESTPAPVEGEKRVKKKRKTSD